MKGSGTIQREGLEMEPKTIATRDTYLVVLPDLTNQVGERLVDVNPLLSGSLDKLATEVLGEITALWKHVSITEIRRQVGMQIPDRNPQWLPRKEYNVPFMPT